MLKSVKFENKVIALLDGAFPFQTNISPYDNYTFYDFVPSYWRLVQQQGDPGYATYTNEAIGDDGALWLKVDNTSNVADYDVDQIWPLTSRFVEGYSIEFRAYVEGTDVGSSYTVQGGTSQGSGNVMYVTLSNPNSYPLTLTYSNTSGSTTTYQDDTTDVTEDHTYLIDVSSGQILIYVDGTLLTTISDAHPNIHIANDDASQASFGLYPKLTGATQGGISWTKYVKITGNVRM